MGEAESAFSLLGLPEKLSLAPGEIETAWRERSREAHPDSGDGDAGLAAAINEAHAILRTPGGRLRHWLERQGKEIPRNATVDGDLMEWFGEVSDLLARADAFLGRKKAATTAIAKALLAEDEFAIQKEIQDRMAALKSAIDGIEAEFPSLESDPDLAMRRLERLRFLEKWNQQCTERLVAILSA